MKSELEALATGYSIYGTDFAAMELLAKYELSAPAWLAEWAEFNAKRLRELLASAESMNRMLNGKNAA